LFGEQSPLARLYDLDGWVLLLGVGHDHNTSLHLAEYRAKIPHRTIRLGSPMVVAGARQWGPFGDVDWDGSEFGGVVEECCRRSGAAARRKDRAGQYVIDAAARVSRLRCQVVGAEPRLTKAP